jgi:hypothetical protein
MDAPPHPLNWYAGWVLLLTAFVSGAALGLFFHRRDFLGGYDALPRRLIRLGHIALAALGLLNLLYGLSPWPPPEHWNAPAASLCFLVGGAAMPAVCFLTAWKISFRCLFFIPVAALMLGAIVTLL